MENERFSVINAITVPAIPTLKSIAIMPDTRGKNLIAFLLAGKAI